MSENIYFPKNSSRADIYEALIPQISAFAAKETSRVTSLANITAIFKEAFNFFWVGFYVVENNELVLGPFQGQMACSRIRYGKGVCGTAWAQSKTLLVDDVDLFPGHIACSSLSRSEIVVPIIKEGRVVAVLDVDSDQLAHFSEVDVINLEKICDIISKIVF